MSHMGITIIDVTSYFRSVASNDTRVPRPCTRCGIPVERVALSARETRIAHVHAGCLFGANRGDAGAGGGTDR